MTENETEGLALLEHAWQDDHGKEILARMAESIKVAARSGDTHWMPTVRNEKGWTVNLKIGRTFAIRLRRDKVAILLVPKNLEARERETLDQAADSKKPFKQVPDSWRYTLRWAKADEIWESVKGAHHDVLPHGTDIEKPLTPAVITEAERVIGFLNEKLHLQLPEPKYDDDSKLGEPAPAPESGEPAPAPGPAGNFGTLIQALRASGLHFSSEVVANYVLALKTKRFAILTGISGTGKTRIATEVARHWSSPRESDSVLELRGILDSIRSGNEAALSLIIEARDEVIGRFQPLFSEERLPELTAEQFKSFLSYEHNKHWKGIARSGGKLTEDMDALRSALRLLFDERRPLRERLQEARPASGNPLVKGLGKATITPLLLVRYPKQYGVLNDVAEKALKAMDLWPDTASAASFADRYIAVNDRLLKLAETLGIDLWTLDALWWGVMDRDGIRPDRGQAHDGRRDSHYTVVPVRPDWVDNRGLLGYFNPLTGEYSTTPFLSLLLDARAEEERAEKDGRDPQPFFVVLDEMNLARVEHYFSDFLSALESGEPIPLHDSQAIEDGETESGLAVPRELEIPGNVFFTGTVNVDETTYMFSPKVLDRAFTIEFDRVDLEGYTRSASADEPTGLHLEPRDGGLRLTPYSKPDRAGWVKFSKLDGGRFHRTLLELHRILEKEHRHFGYRVANEIAHFVNLAREQSADGDRDRAAKAAFDLALLQKVLPKFHGTQQELEAILERLFAFMVSGRDGAGGTGDAPRLDGWEVVDGRLVPPTGGKPASGVDVPAGTPTPGADGPTPPAFPRTGAKIWRMLRRLQQRGFTSFIE